MLIGKATSGLEPFIMACTAHANNPSHPMQKPKALLIPRSTQSLRTAPEPSGSAQPACFALRTAHLPAVPAILLVMSTLSIRIEPDSCGSMGGGGLSIVASFAT